MELSRWCSFIGCDSVKEAKSLSSFRPKANLLPPATWKYSLQKSLGARETLCFCQRERSVAGVFALEIPFRTQICVCGKIIVGFPKWAPCLRIKFALRFGGWRRGICGRKNFSQLRSSETKMMFLERIKFTLRWRGWGGVMWSCWQQGEDLCGFRPNHHSFDVIHWEENW